MERSLFTLRRRKSRRTSKMAKLSPLMKAEFAKFRLEHPDLSYNEQRKLFEGITPKQTKNMTSEQRAEFKKFREEHKEYSYYVAYAEFLGLKKKKVPLWLQQVPEEKRKEARELYDRLNYLSDTVRLKIVMTEFGISQYYNANVGGYKPEMFSEVEVIKDETAPYGWRVFLRGKERKLRVSPDWKSTHKLNHIRVCIAGTYWVNRDMSLASLIWLRYFKKEIPPKMVVDHIDNDPLNNSPDNFQLIGAYENMKKGKKYWKNQKNG